MGMKNIENKKYIGYNTSRQTKKYVHSNAGKALKVQTSGLFLVLARCGRMSHYLQITTHH